MQLDANSFAGGAVLTLKGYDASDALVDTDEITSYGDFYTMKVASATNTIKYFTVESNSTFAKGVNFTNIVWHCALAQPDPRQRAGAAAGHRARRRFARRVALTRSRSPRATGAREARTARAFSLSDDQERSCRRACAGKFLWPRKQCSVTVQYAPTGAGSTDGGSLTVSGLKVTATATLTGNSEASSADISLSPSFARKENVRVINGGPSAATVTVLLECSLSAGSIGVLFSEWSVGFGPPGDQWLTSVNPIPSGGSLGLDAHCFGSGATSRSTPPPGQTRTRPRTTPSQPKTTTSPSSRRP